MVRIIRKWWDELNGRLVAHYFRVYGDVVRVVVFESPLMLKNPQEARGKMSVVKDRKGVVQQNWFSRAQVEMLLSVFDEAKEKNKC